MSPRTLQKTDTRHTKHILMQIVVRGNLKPYPGPNLLALPIRSNRPNKGDPTYLQPTPEIPTSNMVIAGIG